MPGGIQQVTLNIMSADMLLGEILPARSARRLRALSIKKEFGSNEFPDPETVKRLCLNGKLSCLDLSGIEGSVPAFSGGAFSYDASWQAVPWTLQDVTLDVPLDKGIPTIVEQLCRLRRLCLTHCRETRMHLDRPLDPFLDMPSLALLKLESLWQGRTVAETGMCKWTPAALRLLGLAENRIMRMRETSPMRSFVINY